MDPFTGIWNLLQHVGPPMARSWRESTATLDGSSTIVLQSMPMRSSIRENLRARLFDPWACIWFGYAFFWSVS